MIGVELSQIFQRLGSQVTLLEALPSVLPTEDDEISNGLQRVLHGEGIRIFTAAQVTQVQRQEEARVESTSSRRGKSTPCG